MDLPNTKRITELVDNIYIARAEGELIVEEELFVYLINTYRLPNILF